MGILSKYNKALSRFTFKAGEDFEYKSLESLYSSKKGANNLLEVKGLYINHKSKFGDAPVLVSNKFYVNLPKHLCDEVVEKLSSLQRLPNSRYSKSFHWIHKCKFQP